MSNRPFVYLINIIIGVMLLIALCPGQESSQKLSLEEHNQIMVRISQLLVSNYFNKEVKILFLFSLYCAQYITAIKKY